MKISVIVTSFNSAKTIEATLKSIVEQTYKDVELIVIDGGSKDGTQAIVKKFESSISKFISEKDKGSSDALQKGMQLVTGEVVTFVNSDDTLANNLVLEDVMRCFAGDSRLDYVGGALQWVLEENGEKSKIFQSRPDRLLYGCEAYIPSSFFRTSTIRDIPFTSEIEFANDYKLLCELLIARKGKFLVLPQVTVNFTLGGRSAVPKNRIQVKKDMFRVRKQYFGILSALLFAIPDFTTAFLQKYSIRPYTWIRKFRLLIQSSSHKS